MYSAPIPGQALTDDTRKYPWMRPPELNTPEEAIRFHMKKLSNPDVMDDLLFTLEIGYPLAPLVKTMMTMAVMKGFHTVDIGIIISPVIHEYIKSIAVAAGIDYKEGLYEDEAKSKKQKDRDKMRLQKYLDDLKGGKKTDEGAAMVQELIDAPEMELEDMQEAPAEQMQGEVAAPMEAAPVAAPAAPVATPAPQPTAAPPAAGLMARRA